MGVWRLRQFGVFTLTGPEIDSIRFETQRSAKLLALASLSSNGLIRRDSLCQHLWPDDFLDATRLRLRQELSRLRKSLGPASDGILSDHDFVWIDRDRIFTDMEILGIPMATIENLREMTGEFLPGWQDDWAIAERERAHKFKIGLALAIAKDLIEQGRFAEVIEITRDAVALEPSNEQLRRVRLQAQASIGKVPANFAPEPDEDSISMGDTTAENVLGPESGRDSTAQRLNLSYPQSLDRFFGRAHECEEIDQLLASSQGVRLVTISGPGGMGKTRLALEIAHRLSSQFTGGVGFISLAEIDTADQIAGSALLQCGLQPPSAADVLDYFCRALPTGPTLIVFDNMEHLLPEGASILKRIVERAPSLTIVVTSRHPLRLAGERLVVLRPLDLPSEAKDMLLDLWQSVRPGLLGRSSDEEGVALLLEALGGYPLAIRLAAPRLKLLQPGDLARQLSQRLDLLKSDAPDLPERHRSLRNTIDWSIDSLQPAQRDALLRLSSWRGAMDVGLAEALVGDADALPLLEALIDSSLLSMDDSGADVWLHLLEPVRNFMRLRSTAASVDEADLSHAKLIRETVEELFPDCLSPIRFDAIERMDSLRENILSAYAFLTAHDEWLEASLVLRRFARHLSLRGGHNEFLILVEQLDPSWDQLPIAIRADLTASRGGAELAMAHDSRGTELLKEAVSLYESIGRMDAAADLHATIGYSLRRSHKFEEAIAWVREAIARADAVHAPIVSARGAQLLSILLQHVGDYMGACEAAGRSYFALRNLDEDMLRTIGGQLCSAFMFDAGRRDEAMVVAREIKPLLERLGDPMRLAYQHEVDARASFDIGDLATAESEFRASLALWTRLQVGFQIADQKNSIARCLLRRGAYEEGARFLVESAQCWVQDQDWTGMTRSLTVFARIRAAQGRSTEAQGAVAWALELVRRLSPPLAPGDAHDLTMARQEVGEADLPAVSPDAPLADALMVFGV